MTLNFHSPPASESQQPPLQEISKLTNKVLNSYTVEQLKEICRREGITGFSSKARIELERLIAKRRQNVITIPQ